MQRWTAIAIAAGLYLSTTACGEDRAGDTIREDQVEAAEERRREREEILEDHRDLHERMRQLPPDERQRLHEEMHREMQREMGGAPGHGGMRPHQPPGPQHPHGPGQGMGGAPGAAPDTTS